MKARHYTKQRGDVTDFYIQTNSSAGWIVLSVTNEDERDAMIAALECDEAEFTVSLYMNLLKQKKRSRRAEQTDDLVEHGERLDRKRLRSKPR